VRTKRVAGRKVRRDSMSMVVVFVRWVGSLIGVVRVVWLID
jgi:hypothetical protein